MGPPLSGKSTWARERAVATGARVYCTDPRSTVREPEAEVTYLPEGLGWSEQSRYVADHWLPLPGPVVIEGVATVRALRKLLADGRRAELDGAQIVRFTRATRYAALTSSQLGMAKSIDTIWSQIAADLSAITEIK